MAVLSRAALWLSVLVVASGCRGGAEQWGPFRGQVVDAETGLPISGANVMVSWIREPPSLHFSQWVYDAQETETDADGAFEIPRQTHFITAFVNKPGLGFFAPGYLILSEEVTPPNGRKYVDRTVAKMRPLNTREEQCKWRPGEPWAPRAKVPRFMEAVQQYNIGLKCWEMVGKQ